MLSYIYKSFAHIIIERIMISFRFTFSWENIRTLNMAKNELSNIVGSKNTESRMGNNAKKSPNYLINGLIFDFYEVWSYI